MPSVSSPYGLLPAPSLPTLAALFGCEPNEQALLELRAATPPEQYARRLFDAAKLPGLLVNVALAGPGRLGCG